MKISHLKDTLNEKDYLDDINEVWVIDKADFVKLKDGFENAPSAQPVGGVFRPASGDKLFLVLVGK